MRRVFLAVAISAAAVLSSVGVAAPASASVLDDGTGWFLQVTSNTTALIDGYDYDNPGNYVNDIFGSDLVIPSTVGNYTITGITDYAFADRGLTSVVFPASLTSIGTAAFVRNNFTSVTIPAGVTSINDATFAHNALTSVVLPASLTRIEKNAFYDNALTSVTIPDGVTKIDADAFYFNRLASVTIPDSVTTIGDKAFGWNQLTSVTLGQSVSFIGDTAFTSNLLTSVYFPASLTHLGYFSFGGNSLTSATFDGNAPVGNNVFGNNQNLHELRREICTQWSETFSGLPVKLVKKPRCTLPGVPVIKGVVMGNGVVKVGLAAQQDNGKDRIRGYEYTTDNGASWNYVAIGSGDSDPQNVVNPNTLFIRGLSLGTSYSLKIRALNCVGAGKVSKAVSIKPIASASPVRITGVTQGSGQVRINFDAPDSDGASTITRYGYSVDGGAVINAGAVSGSLLIKGLRNGGRYSIRVFALNAAGWGAPSESVIATPKR